MSENGMYGRRDKDEKKERRMVGNRIKYNQSRVQKKKHTGEELEEPGDVMRKDGGMIGFTKDADCQDGLRGVGGRKTSIDRV